MATYTSVSEIFENMCTVFVAEKAKDEIATIQFDLAGENGGQFWVQVNKGTCNSGVGEAPGAVDMTLITTGDEWLSVVNGDLNPMTAFMQGKIKVKGNMGFALKLQQWFTLI